jgi:Polyketide cyclase / dehydrase and lipid transport
MSRVTSVLNVGRNAAASLLVLGLASAGALAGTHSVTHAEGYKAMSMKDDLAHRSPDIHWPAAFEPANADLFAHNELLINASCERVWKHIVDASHWPTWYPNSKDVQIQGGHPVLRDGTVSAGPPSAWPSKARCMSMYRTSAWAGTATRRAPSRVSITPGTWSRRAHCAVS